MISSDVVGASSSLLPRGTKAGMYFRSEDAGDLRRVLEDVLLTPGRLEAMRSSARGAFEEWYVRTTPLKVVPAVVQKLLAMKAGRRQ